MITQPDQDLSKLLSIIKIYDGNNDRKVISNNVELTDLDKESNLFDHLFKKESQSAEF